MKIGLMVSQIITKMLSTAVNWKETLVCPGMILTVNTSTTGFVRYKKVWTLPPTLDYRASLLTPQYVPSAGTNKQKYQHQGSVRPLFHRIRMKALSTDKCSKGTEDQKATRESRTRVTSSEMFPPAAGTLAILCSCRGGWESCPVVQ